MPTIALDQITIGGPCKLTDNSQAIYFDGPVRITPQATWRAIPSAVGGEHDDVLVDLTYKIAGTPKSVWSSGVRGILLPDTLLNWSTAGAALLGTTNNSVTVNGSDANGFTFTRAKLTKPPGVFLGLGAALYDEAEWTAFIGQGKALTDADAFYSLNTTAWSQSDYPTAHQEQMCTAAWGAVTGWTALFSEAGFKLAHELKLNPVKQGGVTVDMKVESYRGMISFTPQQPTTAQLKTALAMDTGGGLGVRRSGNAADFVVSGTGIGVTLKSAGLRSGSFLFDNKMNRHGEFAMVTALTTPGTRLAWS